LFFLAVLAGSLAVGFGHPAVAQSSANPLRNAGFESPPMTAVKAWHPLPVDFDVVFDTRAPYEGQSSLRLDRDATTPGPFTAVAQAIDATPYRGRVIRFRAAARAALADSGSGAGLWLRVDREGGALGFFDNMGDRPIRAQAWTLYEVVGPVAEDANKIVAGFLLQAAGSAWIDAASIEIVPDGSVGETATERPSPAALENLEAFARLYGYVRWFSAMSDPSDPRWTVIAVEGVRDVEQAQGQDDLVRRLQRWFEPMAPGLVLGTAPLGAGPDAPNESGLSRWRHTGVAFANPAYRSERVAAAVPEVWRADLVGGLAVSLPATAVVPEGQTVPVSDRSMRNASSEDRAVRLGGVVIAWNVFRHFYPYFEDDGRAWDDGLLNLLADAAAAPDGPAYKAMLERMVARLDDGHGYVGPDTETFTLPLVWQRVEGALVITGLPSGADPGLSVGDRVLTVDGQPVAVRLAQEQEQVFASTSGRRVLQAAERLRSRETDEPVELEIERGDGARSRVYVRPVPVARMADVLAEPRPAPVTWLPERTWYFDLTRLDNAALSEALARVQPEQSVIFDVRGYPGRINAAFLGHLSTSGVTTPPFRIPVDLLPEARSRSWETVGWSVTPKAPLFSGRIAFLTDARAISYAETLLAMVAGHDLGDIVGSPTAGTNGNSNPFSLPGGYWIAWTGLVVVNHDGTPLSGHGITPTVPAVRTIAGVRAGEDEVLARAVEVVTAPGR
tara:strand:+ start:303 stop:2492 length:2190 start_codon:yes stop_codon:yes gene_type:complete